MQTIEFEDTFVQKNSIGQYFFNSVRFAKAIGEPEDAKKAEEGEEKILNKFLEAQIKLL